MHIDTSAGASTVPTLASYSALSVIERAIVDVCAVFYAPAPRTDIARALGEVGHRNAGRAFKPEDVLPILDGLTAKGWLRGDAHWRVAPELVHAVTRQVARQKRIEALGSAVRYIRPAKESSWEAMVRELRIELYSERWDEVRSCLGRLGPGAFAEICRPYDESWVSSLPEDLSNRAAKEVLERSVVELQPADQALAHLERAAAVDDRLHRVLVEQMILRGRLEDAERLLSQRRSLEADAGRAWLLAVRGRWSEAVDAYERALVRYLKECGKRARFFPDRSGAFFIIALIAKGDPASLDRAQLLVEAASKPGVSAIPAAYATLSPVIEVLAHRRDADRTPQVGSDVDTIALDPLVRLLRLWTAIWIGRAPSRGLVGRLAEQSLAAENAGYGWLAAQSADAVVCVDASRVERLGPVAARCGSVRFVSAVQRHERWSSALDALDRIASSGRGEAPEEPGGDRRLVWIVSEHHLGRLELEPREQTRAKGAWSKGRPVALKRLYAESSTIASLTEADRSACGAIKENVSLTYGRYRDYWYSIDTARALQALAHASNVLIEVDGELRAVEVRARSPRLSIATAADGSFRAVLAPAPVSDVEAVRAHRIGAAVIELVEFDDPHHAIAKVLGSDGLVLPATASPRLRALASALAGVVAVDGGLFPAEAVEADATPRLVMRRAGQGLSMEVIVRPHGPGGPEARPGEGARVLLAELDGRRLSASRDLQEERRRRDEVLARCSRFVAASPTADHFDVSERPAALELLSELRALSGSIAVEWPQGQSLSVTDPIGVERLSLSLSGKGDRFEVEGMLDPGVGEPLALPVLLDYLEVSPARYIPMGEEDRFLALTAELRARLDELRVLSAGSGRSKKRIQFHPLQVSRIDALAGGAKVERDQAWLRQVARMTAAVDDVAVPATLRAELRPYQLDGFRWLARIARWGAGACLADEMGLGKTLQVVALLVSRAADGPSIVVAPTSVVSNWAQELARFAPTLRVRVMASGEDRVPMMTGLGAFDVLLTSYALLVQDIDALERIQFEVAVLDEAQAIKNAETQRARTASRVVAATRIATTGTPIENRVDELWSLFNFLNPDLLGSRALFQARFARPIEQGKDRRALERLKRLVAPFLLRRTKSSVLDELPERIEIDLRVDLAPEEVALYESIRRKALEQIAGAKAKSSMRVQILAAIMQLRRAASNARLVDPQMTSTSSKLSVLADLLEVILPAGHKALVFSQFVDHLRVVRAFLEERGVSLQYLDGSTPQASRREAIDAFQSGVGDVFLISLGAGGFGLNLTAADYVVHLDPWWNPAVEDQASDRTHRIGQTRPVTIYRLVARDTIEDKIVALHRRKRELAASVLEGGDLTGRMTESEMLELIRANDDRPPLC